jgi:hypothetical protein
MKPQGRSIAASPAADVKRWWWLSVDWSREHMLKLGLSRENLRFGVRLPDAILKITHGLPEFHTRSII